MDCDTAEVFLENLAFVLRLAEGAEISWTRCCYFDENELCADVFNPWGFVERKRLIERIYLFSKDNLTALVNIAADWTKNPPKAPFRSAINLLNEIDLKSPVSLLTLKTAGAMVLFEQMALFAAINDATRNNWNYDSVACDLRDDNNKWVTYKDKLICLFNAAGIKSDADILDRLVVMRNDTLHGKDKKISLDVLCLAHSAVVHLLFLLLMGLLKFRGGYNRYAVTRGIVLFPDYVEDDIINFKDHITAYPK